MTTPTLVNGHLLIQSTRTAYNQSRSCSASPCRCLRSLIPSLTLPVPTGANLQRSCESISPYGAPRQICGRLFKEAVAAPSLLTGLGLDSSKRLLCSRQSKRRRGSGLPASMQLPPLGAKVSQRRHQGARNCGRKSATKKSWALRAE